MSTTTDVRERPKRAHFLDGMTELESIGVTTPGTERERDLMQLVRDIVHDYNDLARRYNSLLENGGRDPESLKPATDDD